MIQQLSSFTQRVGLPGWIGTISSVLLLGGVFAWVDITSDPSPRPVSRLTSATNAVEERTCAECHAEIVAGFATSPHANTLHAGSDPDMRRLFADQSAEVNGQKFSFTEDQGELWIGSEDLEYRRRVDWVFGSGRHALTPVALDPDGLTQLSVSYFPDGQFRSTPGISEHPAGVPRLGEKQSEADARRCFGCHVSSMPEETLFHGKPGLDCNRCHFETSEHAASGGDDSTIPLWNELSPLDAVNRCGECHRRSDEMKPEEISIDEKHLVRFAPVGLVMSRCFQVANAPENADIFPRMDCITCHDPHLPSRTKPSYFEAICRQCHVAAIPNTANASSHVGRSRTPPDDRIVPCSAQPSDSACLSCHMPKTNFAPGLRFTDHWIR